MSLTVKASTGGLDEFARRLADMRSGWQLDVLPDAAKDIDRDLERSFSARTEPAGNPWAPRQSGGGHPLLEKTGQLRASKRVSVVTHLIVVAYSAAHAVYIHGGTRHMTARPLFSQVVPPAWREALQQALLRRLERLTR